MTKFAIPLVNDVDLFEGSHFSSLTNFRSLELISNLEYADTFNFVVYEHRNAS